MHEYAARETMTPLRAEQCAVALALPVSCSSDQRVDNRTSRLCRHTRICSQEARH